MRAVLVFCEGNHDVKFVTRSLGAIVGVDWQGQPISDLPSPFGPVKDPLNPRTPTVQSFITRRYSARSLEEQRLMGAAHPPPPSFEAIVKAKTDNTLYVVLKSQGDDASVAAIDLLDDLLTQLFDPVEVTQIAAAFLFDADDAGVTDREAAFATAHAPLLNGSITPLHGQWVLGKEFPVGLFIFHNGTTNKGTLEDVLSPLVSAEWPQRWQEAGAYLTRNAKPTDPVIRKAAEMSKAQICITGQFILPGDAMSQVLDRRGLPASRFQGPVSQSLVTFLSSVPW